MSYCRRLMLSSERYRRRFGTLRGLWFWLGLRRQRLLPQGSRFKLRIPGLRQPVLLRAGTSDSLVLEEIIVDDELGFALPDPPRTILDLGANIGLSSIYLANKFPQARILAVEMEPSNLELLRRNVQPYPTIAVVAKAIWHREGYVCIENPRDEPWAFRARHAEPKEPGAIEAISVPALLRRYGWHTADFVKLDIEGAERELFAAGASDWLLDVSVLAVELHDRFREGCTQALLRCLTGIPNRMIARGHYTIVILGTAASAEEVAV